MKKLIAFSAAAVAALQMFGAGPTVEEIGVSQESRSNPVVLGQWHGDYEKCKALADSEHIPMIVYFGQTGCSRCSTLTTTLMSDTFAKWRADKRLILLYMKQGNEGNGYSDSSKAKSWVKSVSTADGQNGFPYFGYYLDTGKPALKVYGKTAKTFTAEQIIKEAETFFGAALTGGVTPPVKPVEPPTPPPVVDPEHVFSGNQDYTAACWKGDELVGALTVSAAKPRNEKSRIKGKFITIEGKKISFSGQVPTGPNVRASFVIRNVGVLTLTFTKSRIEGSLDDGAWIEVCPVGGTVTGTHELKLELSSFALPEGYEIVKEALKPSYAFTAVSKSKWDFGKNGSLKYSKVDGNWVLKGLDSANPACIKLSYTASYGLVKGQMKVYASNAKTVAAGKKPTLKKYSLKIYGLVVDGEAQLLVFNKKDLVGVGVAH